MNSFLYSYCTSMIKVISVLVRTDRKCIVLIGTKDNQTTPTDNKNHSEKRNSLFVLRKYID